MNAASENEPIVEVRHLAFAYPGGPPALADVCFSIREGESVGLVGPNGAGKTSLFLCLAGVLPVPPERIRLAGLDPGQRDQRRQLPSRVGIVFQNSDDQLFSATVEDDVAFGPLNLDLAPAEVKQRVAEALAQVHMTGTEARAPYHLSGGEKRRVALAGVLAMRPAILLLDEPSMFLDPRGRRDLIEQLKGLPGTRIVAAHDLDLILDVCARVLVLDGGRVRADGPPRDILGDAALMAAHGLEVPYRLRH